MRFISVGFASLALCLNLTPSIAQTVDNTQRDAIVAQADSAYSRGNWVAAASLYEEGCVAFHARACSYVGYIYSNGGGGILVNLPLAFSKYERACSQNYYPACSSLGRMHELGQSVPSDYSRALQLYEQACNAQDREGCARAAYYYEKGYVVPANRETAIRLARKAISIDPDSVLGREILTRLGQR